jgi:F0F1-type ATP synthase epsilon subunit
MEVRPEHTFLVSTLNAGEILYRKGDKEGVATIGEGFVEVGPDEVAVVVKRLALPKSVRLKKAAAPHRRRRV